MSFSNAFRFDENHVYVGHRTWNDIVGNPITFPLFNAVEMMKNVVLRNGAAMILMPDEEHIQFRMDRLSEVRAVSQRANEERQQRGLQLVDLQQLGLQ